MFRRHTEVGVCLVMLLTLSAADLAHHLPPLSAAGSSSVLRCVCSRGASVADVASHADLLAIGTADKLISRRLPNGERVSMYRVRLARAWRWPGSAPTPPRYVDVYSFDLSSCSGYVGRDESYVVQANRVSVARVSDADTLLSLAGRCSLEGPADTTGPFGSFLRKEYGEEVFRRWARGRKAELDSLRLVLGPGVEPSVTER